MERLSSGVGGSAGLSFFSADVELWDSLVVSEAKMEVDDSRLYGKAPFEMALTGPESELSAKAGTSLVLFPYTRLQFGPRCRVRLTGSFIELRRHSTLVIQSGVRDQFLQSSSCPVGSVETDGQLLKC